MWTQFLLSQVHFILHLITALVFVAIGWLYFDAWKGQKHKKEGIRSIGFLFVALSFIISAVTLQKT